MNVWYSIAYWFSWWKLSLFELLFRMEGSSRKNSHHPGLSSQRKQTNGWMDCWLCVAWGKCFEKGKPFYMHSWKTRRKFSAWRVVYMDAPHSTSVRCWRTGFLDFSHVVVPLAKPTVTCAILMSCSYQYCCAPEYEAFRVALFCHSLCRPVLVLVTRYCCIEKWRGVSLLA